MATIAELIAKLGLDNSQFNKKLKDSQDKLEDFGDESEKSGKKAKDGFDGASKGADGFSKVASKLGPIIGAAFAADALIGFGKNVINTTAEFQKMEAVLTNTLGSNSAAKVAMDEIVEFASKTPFAVNELTESFVKLANRGFVPTQDELRSLGDLASSTGKSFDQLTEAALDAMTGEFERLKEFGIRASSEGDRVKFTFKGVTTEVAKTEDAIKDYLLSLGNAEGVSGAMAAISETVGGKISNLGDNFTQLYKVIGDGSSGLIAGVLDLSNALLSHLAGSIDAVNTIAEKTGENGLVTFGKQLFALINPQYATQLQMVAKGIKAIDKASSDAMMAGRAHFEAEGKARAELLEGAKELSDEEKKLAEKRKKEHEERIKQLRKEQQEFATHVKLLTKIDDRDPFSGQVADPNRNVSKDRAKMMEDASKKIIELNKQVGESLKKSGIIIPQDAIERQKAYQEEQIKIAYNQQQIAKKMAVTDAITSMLGNTFQSAFEGMLNSGKVSFRGIIDGLKALIIKLIAAAAAAAILAGILAATGLGAAGGFLGNFKDIFGKMSGLGGLFSKSKAEPFAEGGMVTGLTSAILGDNPSGKEAVIPFEKMGGFLRQFGTGSDNMRVEVVGSLRGEDIFFSGINYQNGRNKIIGG